jgi:hypothetical protein
MPTQRTLRYGSLAAAAGPVKTACHWGLLPLLARVARSTAPARRARGQQAGPVA